MPLNWAAWPPLPHQPIPEFSSNVPFDVIPGPPATLSNEQKIRVNWPHAPGPFQTVTLAGNFTFKNRTLTAKAGPVMAMHFIAGPLGYSDGSGSLTAKLGEHYALRVSDTESTLAERFELAAGNRIVLVELLDDETVLSTARMIGTSSDGYLGATSLCVGYARSTEGDAINLYGHVFRHSGVSQFATNGTCGSGTVSLLSTIDAARIGDGRASIVVGEGEVFISKIACRYNLFETSNAFVMDKTADKNDREGERIGWSLSRAPLFCASNDLRDKDCAGHPELAESFDDAYGDYSVSFPIVVPGQPDADVAWVAQSEEWRANCGFTEEQNLKTSRLSVECDGIRVKFGTSAFLPTFTLPTFTIDELVCTEYGNNEYFGESEETLEVEYFGTYTIGNLKVFVTIAGTEQKTTLTNERLPLEYLVTVRFTGAIQSNGNRGSWAASKTLTESEADSFFSGGELEITQTNPANGSVTITAIGDQ